MKTDIEVLQCAFTGNFAYKIVCSNEYHTYKQSSPFVFSSHDDAYLAAIIEISPYK